MSSVITTRQAGIVDVEAGRNVTVIEPCNLYGCRLGDDVFVGPFVEIQRHV
ncbi:N-acetyltransferase, partial [Klebsiella pneumoniae]|nr:N-acetyltransferase [Klebsiella pneumoniae]